MSPHRSSRSNCVGFGATFSVFFFVYTALLWSSVGLRLPEPYSPIAPLAAPKQTILFSQGDSLSRLGPYFPSAFRHEVKIDTVTGNTVIARIKYNDRDILFPKIMTLNNYLRWRFAHENQAQWKEYAVTHIASTAADRSRGLVIETPRIKSKAFESIFGGNTMSLEVDGSITIDASMRNEKRSQQKSAFTRGSNTNFQMKQTQRFKVTGKIGENLSINVDQDSERPFEFENAIKLHYRSQGEDGIVKSIEAGNVSLSLPGTRFVTVSAQNAGLFGIKAEMKVGPLDITTIASMEKGQKSKKTFEGGSEKEANEIQDYDYIKNTYYFLDTDYRDNFQIITATGQHVLVDSLIIDEIEVFRCDGTNKNGQTGYFAAWATVAGDTTEKNLSINDTKRMFYGDFQQLTEGTDYAFDNKLGFIKLNRAINDNEILAVTYRRKSGKSYGHQKIIIDNENSDTQWILKMIKPRNPQPKDRTWELEWRHAYSLRGRNINKESFELKIFQKTSSGDPIEILRIGDNSVGFLNIFGLDNYNSGGDAKPDNIIDNNPNFLNLAEGILIFPDLRPFDPDPGSTHYSNHPELYQALKDKNLLTPAIYDTTHRQYISNQSRFFIQVKSSSRSATFNLGMNVIEGSEEVILNGRRLTKDLDYSLEPFSGTLTMLNQDALDPTAKLEISYENQQLFSIDKKTLMGMRAEYTLWESGSNRSFIGGTLLYLNQKTLDRRVRVGQDSPMRNVVWDVNTAVKLEPAFIDRALEAVPFLHSSGRSTLNFEGEVAQVIPNPNTLNNDATGDHNGVAYLDDFEGSRRQISLSVMDKGWHFSAAPHQTDPVLHLPMTGRRPLSTRGHMIWYNPYNQVPIQEIWPEREVTANFGGTTRTHVLDLQFFPNDTLQYPGESWFGIMQALSTGYFDQSDSRFLELWIYGEHGRVHVDMGRISEDAIPNERLDTEDRPVNGVLDGTLDDGEDVGLDGVIGEDPPELFYPHVPAFISDGKAEPYDFWDLNGDSVKQEGEPWSYDNWKWTQGSPDYSQYNGTENSASSATTRYPDTEDLNNNGYIDTANDYFTASFSLENKDYMAGGGAANNGWTLYRIPIKDFAKVGSPDIAAIEYIRLWVDDVDLSGTSANSVLIRIAEINLTGNEWKLRGVVSAYRDTVDVGNDSTLTISVINTHDNPEYSQPAGVEGVEDPVYKIKSKEQALVMTLNGLAPGATALAERSMMPEVSILEYKKLKMFVHGGGFSNQLSDADSVAFFLRLGSDQGEAKKDYYEIEIPKVQSGWDDHLRRNYIEVDLDSLSKWKNEMDVLELDSLPEPKILPNGHRVRIMGKPSLTRIVWLRIGVKNNGNYFSDEIWLNELRVSDVRKDKGMAYRLKGDVALTDLIRVNAEINHQDSDFHTVNERVGRGANTDDFSFMTSFKLDKFLPSSWGISLPVTYNQRKSESLPKFKPGSDIFSSLLSEEEKDLIRNKSESKGLSLSVSKRTSSRNILVKYLVDPLSGRVSYSNGLSSSSTIAENLSTGYQASGSYKLNFSGQKYVEPFKWMGQKKVVKPVSDLKLYYLPSSVSFDMSAADKRNTSVSRMDLVSGDTTINYNQTFSTGYAPFKSLNLTYNWKQAGDLRNGPEETRTTWREVIESMDIAPGAITSKEHAAGASYTPSFATWLRPNFKYNAAYQWSNNLQMLKRDTDTGETASKNASISLSGNLDFKRLMQSMGKKSSASGASGRNTRRRPRSSPDAKPQEEEGTVVQDEEKKSTFQFMKILGYGGKVLSSLEPISISYNTSVKATHNGIIENPTWAYKLGMSQQRDLRTSEEVTQPGTYGVDNRWSVRSGFSVTSQVSVKLDFSTSNNKNETTQKIRGITESYLNALGTPFPGWTVNWRGLERLPLVKNYVKSASLNHGFAGTKSLNLNNNDTTNVTISSDFRPLIGLNFSLKNGISSTFAYNTNESIKEEKSFSSGNTRNVSGTINFTLKYQKRGGISLFFMKGKKLDNNIDFSMTYSNSNNQTFVNKGEGEVETRATSNWSLKPQMSYTFSKSVQGGLYFEFGERKDKITGKTAIKAFGLNTVISLAGR